MKQILLELWTDNKRMPAILTIKFILIFLMLTFGIWIRGFLYAILFWFWIICLTPITVLPIETMDMLLPMSAEQIRRKSIKRAFIVSIFYTVIISMGYVFTIQCSSKYSWNCKTFILIFVVATFTFLMQMEVQLLMERIRQGLEDMTDDLEYDLGDEGKQNENRVAVLNGIPNALCAGYLFEILSNTGGSMIEKPFWQIVFFILYIVISVWLIFIIRNYSKME